MTTQRHDVEYRWIMGSDSTDLEWSQIQFLIESHGWPILNRQVSRVLVAIHRGTIIGLSTVQLMPSVGPLIVDKSFRGMNVAEELADQTLDFLRDANARGWIVIAESKHSENLCEDRGMERLESPVFISKGGVKSADF